MSDQRPHRSGPKRRRDIAVAVLALAGQRDEEGARQDPP